MSVSCQIEVRSYELDMYNHVNNANYLNYLEHGRMEFLRRIGFDFKGFSEEGYGIYVVRVDIRYKRPAFQGDILTIESRPLNRQRLKGVIGQLILRDGEILAEAEVTYATVDASGRPCRIPERFEVPGLHPDTE